MKAGRFVCTDDCFEELPRWPIEPAPRAAGGQAGMPPHSPEKNSRRCGCCAVAKIVTLTAIR